MKSSSTTSTIKGVLKNQHEVCTRLGTIRHTRMAEHRTPCRNTAQPAVEFQHMLHGLGTITSLRIDDVVSSTTVNSATVRRGQTKFASQVPTAPLATQSIVTSRVKNKLYLHVLCCLSSCFEHFLMIGLASAQVLF